VGYDFEYEADERYDGRILWGRIAVYGVAFLLVFVLGSCWGARGGADDGDIARLEAEVEELRAANAQLEETIDAMSAGVRDEQPTTPPTEPEETENGNGETPDPAERRTYIVQPGDTLRGIARDIYGDPNQFDLIAAENNLTNESVLRVGQELIIPPLPTD
jgi:nucleoid-associated protein YgaU